MGGVLLSVPLVLYVRWTRNVRCALYLYVIFGN